MIFTRFSLLVIVCFLALAGRAGATTYYVRTSGNDSKNGQTPHNAWRTINKAAERARAGDTVYVGGGTYLQSTPAMFVEQSTALSPIKLIADTTGVKTGDAGNV